ncbi:MAG: dienelactone hydrolase family protein [Verrucomicrobiota bacterium]
MNRLLFQFGVIVTLLSPDLLAIEVQGANGKLVNFAGVREVIPAGMIVRVKVDSADLTIGYDQLDLADLEKRHPQIHAAVVAARGGETTVLDLGCYAGVPVDLDLETSPRISTHETTASKGAWMAELEPFVWQGGSDGDLYFRFFQPESRPLYLEKLPLVIYLHGTGGGGDDNVKHVPSTKGGMVFVTDLIQKEHPCFVLVPQAQGARKWSMGAHVKTPDPVDDVHNLVSELLRRFPVIDGDRIYVTGFSMGGSGAFRMLFEYPDSYAAAVPVAGPVSDDEFRRIRELPPIWFFFNEDDDFHIRWFRETETSLKKLGNDHKITAYPKGGHSFTVNAYAEPEMIEWLFQQKRRR